MRKLSDTPTRKQIREGRERMRIAFIQFAFLAKTEVREVQRLAKNLPSELHDKLDKVYIALNNMQEFLSDPRYN